MRIDSHQHFWKFDSSRDSWIDDEMAVIRRDFLPADIEPVLIENKIGGCIAVQADQSEEETHFLLDLAVRHDFIKGIVGWVDLCDENVEERLAYFSKFDKLRGFRHIIQAEPEVDFMLKPDFCRGISTLKKFGFTYDILVYSEHLPSVTEFVSRFPDQPFVINHLAKPLISEGKIEDWKKHMTAIASFPNVFCKLSGMVTQADLKTWQPSDFKPYIEVVIESFGINRVMFGSDWPVCLLGASYKQCCLILEQNTLHLSRVEKEKLWGLNAIDFYQLGS